MFRFTIRDVLWLTFVVGMGVMLWQAQSQLARQAVVNDQARKQIAELTARLDRFRAANRELAAELHTAVEAERELRRLKTTGDRLPPNFPVYYPP